MTTAGTSPTGAASSSSPTRASEFFEDLGRRDDIPFLRTMAASIRFDLDTGHRIKRWRVVVDHGDVTVTHGAGDDSDCVVAADAELFDRIVRGDANLMASLARGAVSVEGDVRPLVRFQRLLPGPTPGRTPS